MKQLARILNVTLAALLMTVGYIMYFLMVVFEYTELVFSQVALFLFSNAKFVLAKNMDPVDVARIEAEVNASE